MTHGISFPADPDGRRSTTELGREVVADALRGVDPAGALGVEQETNWRSGYLAHFRRLVEAGLISPEAWVRIARDGLESVGSRMVVADPDADDSADAPLASLATATPSRTLRTEIVHGAADPTAELSVPYRGRVLRGAELVAQLAAWAERGILEPSAAEAVGEVVAHPEWLAAEGHTVVVLGAGAEMGPLAPLLRWGATVAAVDLPREAVWERVRRTAAESAGRLLVPVGADGAAGADLLAEVPDVAAWAEGLDGRLVVGNYLYADGATHVRVSVAADVLGTRLIAARPGTGRAFLATPTDVFAVPRAAVEASNAAYAQRSALAKTLGRPLRWASRGRLLHRAYPPGADPGIGDSLVPVQGPNYALAKRIQRWRASVSRADGELVSFHVAPSTRTRSVVKNRALAAAFAGAHRFGVEVFEPATANTLMAALLVRDLAQPPARHAHPWQDEDDAAVHGGLWRAAYEPRSALGLAAVLGYGSARG
ncbi:hypothetical protein [Nocardioides sp. GXZ039]|uniref:hypothetical protein n=1 Tax=Nocardioides sp. GXZ039 TaxID=3136018 RepID=UPI0030F43F0F